MAAAIETVTKTQPVAHWVGKLNEAGVPCSPINTIDKLFDHPQLLARDMFIKVRSGEHGRPVKTAGNPVRIGGYRGNNIVDPISAPTLNQHREAILHEFMASRESYVPAYAGAVEDDTDPAPEREPENNVTPLKQKQL